jgi:type I restriction enzyme, S subunit
MTMADESTKDTKGEANGLPAGWVWAPLGDLATYVNGRAFKPADWGEQGRPIIRIQNLTRSTDVVNRFSGAIEERYLIRDGDLLISWSATLGAYIYRGEEAVLNQHIFKVLPRVDKKYLFYLVSTYLGDLKRKVHGSGMQHITKGKFEESLVPLAPPDEQPRIVAKIEEHLSRLDAAVTSLKRVQAALKRYRAAVLKAACEGRLVPQEPNDEPAAKVLDRILAERRARWEADLRAKGKDPAKAKYDELTGPNTEGLPALPEGWCWASLDYLLAQPLSHGKSVPAAENGFPVLRLTALRNGGIDISQVKLGALSPKDAKPYLVHAGDFLVSRGNGSIKLVGRGGLVETEPDPVIHPDLLIRVRVNPELCYPRYLAAVWSSPLIRSQIESVARTTAGIFKINQHDMRCLILPLPPIAEQRRIALEIEQRLSIVRQLEEAVASNLGRAERLRQAVLRRAFEGKLVPHQARIEKVAVSLGA